MKSSIDINVDVGEGYNNEESFIQYISSANIACGGHFGSYESITKVVELCKKHDVNIGAHPSYPDFDNFGRVVLDISLEELSNSISTQLKMFKEVCVEQGIEPSHLKPHGALYHTCFHDEIVSMILLDLCETIIGKIKIVCAPESIILKLARARGFEIFAEGFADRAYNKEGRLLSRKEIGSSIVDIGKIKNQVEELIMREQVITIEGEIVPLQIDTICFHGDATNAPQNIYEVYQYLKKLGIVVL